MLPVGDVAGGEERVLAGVPAKEVGRVGVAGMGFAAGPDFVEQEGGGAFGGAVQVIGEAAVFLSSGTDKGAQFGFEEHLLAVARAQLDDERHSAFRELGALGRPGFRGTG